MYETLCIFTIGGHTFTFRDVKVLVDNEDMLVFNYSASSDNNHKHFVGFKSKIVGYSTKDYEKD